MTCQQIDEAIKRHADFEMLYDKLYEDMKTVRVTGPFTVEIAVKVINDYGEVMKVFNV